MMGLVCRVGLAGDGYVVAVGYLLEEHKIMCGCLGD